MPRQTNPRYQLTTTTTTTTTAYRPDSIFLSPNDSAALTLADSLFLLHLTSSHLPVNSPKDYQPAQVCSCSCPCVLLYCLSRSRLTSQEQHQPAPGPSEEIPRTCLPVESPFPRWPRLNSQR